MDLSELLHKTKNYMKCNVDVNYWPPLHKVLKEDCRGWSEGGIMYLVSCIVVSDIKLSWRTIEDGTDRCVKGKISWFFSGVANLFKFQGRSRRTPASIRSINYTHLLMSSLVFMFDFISYKDWICVTYPDRNQN